MRTYLGNLNQRLLLVAKNLRDPRRGLADSWLRLEDLNHRLLRSAGLAIRVRKRELGSEARSLVLHSPLNRIAALRQKMDFQRRSLAYVAARRMKEQRMLLSLLEERIKDMNPLSILKRGYAVVRKLPEKWILKSASQVSEGDRVSLSLAEGGLECRVEKVTQG